MVEGLELFIAIAVTLPESGAIPHVGTFKGFTIGLGPSSTQGVAPVGVAVIGDDLRTC
jgi:hypothetical protein